MADRELYKSASIMLVGFSLIGIITNSFVFASIFRLISLLLLLLFVISKVASHGIIEAWNKFGELLGWINSRLLLGTMFYVVFTPIGLLRKLISPKNQNEIGTTFVTSPQVYNKEYFSKLW